MDAVTKALLILAVSGAVLACQTDRELATDQELAKDRRLNAAVARLKQQTPISELDSIRAMDEPDLIVLLHGYGTWIRNQWIHGNRDPQLVKLFHDRGITDPERISMILIQALWNDLNRNLSPSELAEIDAKRGLVKRKLANYERLETECQSFVERSVATFEACYRQHGLPSENPLNRDPFFNLIVENTGRVKTITFFDSTTQALKSCLGPPIEAHKFSPFTDDPEVRLYIVSTPFCRVAQRDTLYR